MIGSKIGTHPIPISPSTAIDIFKNVFSNQNIFFKNICLYKPSITEIYVIKSNKIPFDGYFYTQKKLLNEQNIKIQIEDTICHTIRRVIYISSNYDFFIVGYFHIDRNVNDIYFSHYFNISNLIYQRDSFIYDIFIFNDTIPYTLDIEYIQSKIKELEE
ncbi:hypothetical protein CWI37_0967p0020 [Hamiltosporidium tvaerminnensis]|uniref:Uncharacterized protein n=1 Tax=Hamiltosporidium tvaerminnensis TaxID=1176355 RepID=A0A4Q9L0L7_9MICR|nr:hypothetical protein CWI37_0967p0020 [Hamiltosporidium tvaerminnensis]